MRGTDLYFSPMSCIPVYVLCGTLWKSSIFPLTPTPFLIGPINQPRTMLCFTTANHWHPAVLLLVMFISGVELWAKYGIASSLNTTSSGWQNSVQSRLLLNDFHLTALDAEMTWNSWQPTLSLVAGSVCITLHFFLIGAHQMLYLTEACSIHCWWCLFIWFITSKNSWTIWILFLLFLLAESPLPELDLQLSICNHQVLCF